MKTSTFFKKIFSPILWINMMAMATVIVLLTVGAKVAMDYYTHHGESIVVPDVRNHSYEISVQALEDMGFEVVVNDTGYVKSLAPGTVLEQIPEPGTHVKSGRTIFLTINSTNTPTLVLPDIIDNCSLREATAKLRAMGFKLGAPQYIPGEKDWVYGVLADGKSVTTGQRISVESTLVIQTGNGLRDEADSIYFADAPEHDEYDGYDSDEEIEIRSGNGHSYYDDYNAE